MPPTCMNITFGLSQKKWLCSAVTSRPASSAALITGFTWSSRSTMSPITMVCLPALVNAAQAVSPIGGVMRTPPTTALMSVRGSETLNTPSLASSTPLAPVSCSIAAVASGSSAAAAARRQSPAS